MSTSLTRLASSTITVSNLAIDLSIMMDVICWKVMNTSYAYRIKFSLASSVASSLCFLAAAPDKNSMEYFLFKASLEDD